MGEPKQAGTMTTTTTTTTTPTATATDHEQERGQDTHNPLRIEKRALVRLSVCVLTLWLGVLLLSLLVVVGMYTPRANQMIVMSSVAVVAVLLVMATCKLNSIAGVSKMVAEEVAAKEDPPPTYEDVLDSEAPPPPYFAVVSEAAGGGEGKTCTSSAKPVICQSKDKEGTFVAAEDNHLSKHTWSQDNRNNPTFRRWLSRPGILHSVMFRSSWGSSPSSSSSSSCPAQPIKVSGGRGRSLRRTSSTPSLAGVAALAPPPPPPFPRCPSTPSLCEPCACF